MKDDEDKSNQPTLPPPAGQDMDDMTVARAAPPEVLELMAKAYKKGPAEPAPLLASSTLEEDDGWGPLEKAKPASTMLTDSMKTPQAFEIYNAAPTVEVDVETPNAESVEAAPASAGAPSSNAPKSSPKPSAKPPRVSMPTPLMMPIQPPPPSRAPEVPPLVALPPTPALLQSAQQQDGVSASPMSSISPPPKTRVFDGKFIAALVFAVLIVAAIGAWALR